MVRSSKFRIACMVQRSKLGRNWVEDHSPLLVHLRREFGDSRPFEGLRIGVCLPGTWESFMFLLALQAGGARVLYYPMFCKPEVGLELLKTKNVQLFDRSEVEKCVRNSDFVYDSTAFFGRIVIQQHASVKGIIEQTASGIIIYRDFDAKNSLRQPVFDLDSSYVKRVGENKIATGLGLVEALLKLHLFLPAKHVLVLGWGSVGSGCAMYLKNLGCKVAVFDVDLAKLADAEKSGYQVGGLDELLPVADIVVNATGSSEPVLRAEELKQLKSGAILVNMGGNGWDRAFFADKMTEAAGDWITKIYLNDATHFYEIAKGLPVNFIFASGTDTETMDMVFSLSLLAFEHLVKNYSALPKTLQPIPDEIQNKHLELVERLSKRTDILQRKEE